MPQRECLCGHTEDQHKDKHDDWTTCHDPGCGCLAFAAVRDVPVEPDADDVFIEGCPDCGNDTVVDDPDCCVRCTACGWRE